MSRTVAELTPLAEVLDRVRPEGDEAALEVPGDWTQGRTLFGGLTVALALRMARRSAPDAPALRGLMAQFVGPVRPGALRLVRRRLRAGTSVVQEQVELYQRERLCLVVLATYGRILPVERTHPGAPLPEAPLPDALEGLEPLLWTPGGRVPDFTRHLDYRFLSGTLPFAGARDPVLGGWFRLQRPGEVPAEELVALHSDAWPAAALPFLRRPVPSSTVSWWLALTPYAITAKADAWFFHRGDAEHVDQGYAPARTRLWDRDGRLLAVGAQLDAVFS